MSMRHESCDRARQWVSLALDDALSDLECRLLAAHLARCEECQSFQRRARRVSLELRNAALVPLERPIALPARPRRLTAVRIASASAAAAAAIVVAGVLALANSSEQVRSSLLTNPRFDQPARPAEAIRPLRPQFSHVQMVRAEI
jgi:hypothetical protein